MAKIAAVAGGTGMVGSMCVEWLLADMSYSEVISFVRRAPLAAPRRLTPVVVDFDAPELPPGKADHVFCALGTTIKKAGSQAEFRKVDFDYVRKVAEWAKQAGATQFCVVSSVGADSDSGNFYLRTKGEMENAVAAIAINGVHIFRPSFLVGERQEHRAGEAFGIRVASMLKFAMIAGARKYRPIAASELAKAMIGAANHGDSGTHVYDYDDIRRLAHGWSPDRTEVEVY